MASRAERRHTNCASKYTARNARLSNLGFGSYDDYLRSTSWKVFREFVMAGERFGICIACGCRKNLHLHHIDYSHVGQERLCDVVPICGMCHSRVHDWEHETIGADLRDVERQLVEIFGLPFEEATSRWQPFKILRDRYENGGTSLAAANISYRKKAKPEARKRTWGACSKCGRRIGLKRTHCRPCKKLIEGDSLPQIQETTSRTINTPRPRVMKQTPPASFCVTKAAKGKICLACGTRKKRVRGTGYCEDCAARYGHRLLGELA